MAENAGSIFSEIRIELDKLRADTKQAENIQNSLNTNSKKKANIFTNLWNNAFKAITGYLAFRQITKIITQAIGGFAEFGQKIANVVAVAGDAPGTFEKLEQAAKDAGETTRFKASEAADALYFLASAGLDATQATQALSGVLTLAGATGSELAATAQTLTSTLSQYGLEATEGARVANVFAAANANSQATLEKLSGAFKQVGPVAAGLGISLEETTGALQLLFNAGFEGETSGRALKSALADLANEGSVTNDKLKALGITFDKVNPEKLGLVGSIRNLEKANLSTAEVIDVFGKVAGPQLVTLLKQGSNQIEKYTKAVTNTNEATRQFAVQNNTLQGDFDKLTSKAEAVGLSFAGQFGRSLRVVIRNITELLGKLKPFTDLLGGLFNIIFTVGGKSIEIFSDLTGATTDFIEKQILINSQIERQKSVFETNGKEIEALQERYRRLQARQKAGETVTAELNDVITELNAILPETNQLVATEATSYEELVKQLEAAELATKRLTLIGQQKQLQKQVKALNDVFVEQEGIVFDLFRSFTKQRVNPFEAAEIGKDFNDRVRNLREFFKEQIKNGELTVEQVNEIASKPFDIGRLQGFKKELEELYRRRTRALDVEGQLTEVTQELKDTYKEINKSTADIKDNLNETDFKADEDIKKTSTSIEDLNKKAQDLTQNVLKKTSTSIEDLNKKAQDLTQNVLKEAKKGVETFAEGFSRITSEIVKDLSELGSAITSLIQNQAKAQEDELDRQLEAQLRANGLLEETTGERLAREIDAAKAAGDTTLANEKEKELARLTLTEEFERKKAQVRYEADLAAWGISLAVATAKAAEAIVVAAAGAPWPFNLPAIGFASLIGGLNVAAVAAAKPIPPKFQTGGIVPGSPGSFGDTTTIAVNPNERILTNEDQAILSNVLQQGAAAGGPMEATFNLYFDSIIFAKAVARVFNKGVATIKPRAIRNSN
jgi:TP901 family phage tail tape measure protein